MTSVASEIVYNAGLILGKAMADTNAPAALVWDCEDPSAVPDANQTRADFDAAVQSVITEDTTYLLKRDKHEVPLITAPVDIAITTRNNSGDVAVGT